MLLIFQSLNKASIKSCQQSGEVGMVDYVPIWINLREPESPLKYLGTRTFNHLKRPQCIVEFDLTMWFLLGPEDTVAGHSDVSSPVGNARGQRGRQLGLHHSPGGDPQLPEDGTRDWLEECTYSTSLFLDYN